MARIQKRRKEKSTKSRKSGSLGVKRPKILLRDRNHAFHDPLTGRFVSRKISSRSYYRDLSNRIRDPGGLVLDRDTRHEIEIGIVLGRRPRGRAKDRVKAVTKIAKEIKKRRRGRTEKERAERRKRAPRDRRKRIEPREAPEPRKRKGGVRDWKDRIKEALENTRKAMGIEGRIAVVRNADGSVDGEMRLQVPVGVEAREVIKSLSGYAEIPERTWLCISSAYTRDALSAQDRERYLIVANKIDVAPTYQVSRFRGEQFATALTICDDMAKVHKCQPDQIVMRINWNGEDDRPERKGEK